MQPDATVFDGLVGDDDVFVGGVMTQDEHYDVVALSWRYAVLIGITSPDGMFSDEIVKADLKRWGHLVKRNMGGRPVFIDDDAVDFMARESGQSIEDCKRVLADEWALSEDMIVRSGL